MTGTILDRVTAALADQYRILRELGSGGMATVYLAHDVKHDRKVAFKVLRLELAAMTERGDGALMPRRCMTSRGCNPPCGVFDR